MTDYDDKQNIKNDFKEYLMETIKKHDIDEYFNMIMSRNIYSPSSLLRLALSLYYLMIVNKLFKNDQENEGLKHIIITFKSMLENNEQKIIIYKEELLYILVILNKYKNRILKSKKGDSTPSSNDDLKDNNMYI